MQEIDAQEIILKIIQQAQESKPTEFHLIKTWHEYNFYWDQEESLRVLTKALRNSANFIFKSYCKEVAQGEADFNKLLAYKHFQTINNFYNQELTTVRNMLAEYHEYLNSGNFVAAVFLGTEREV